MSFMSNRLRNLLFIVNGKINDDTDQISELEDPFLVDDLITVDVFVTSIESMKEAYSHICKLK